MRKTVTDGRLRELVPHRVFPELDLQAQVNRRAALENLLELLREHVA